MNEERLILAIRASPAPGTPGPYRPTIISSCSEARGRTCFHRSMVKMVLELLKMDVSEDMSAATITAIMRPRSPGDRGDLGFSLPRLHPDPVTPDPGRGGAGPAPQQLWGSAPLPEPMASPHPPRPPLDAAQPAPPFPGAPFGAGTVPVGRISSTSLGYAMSEQPDGLPHTSWQISGTTQATWSGGRRRP